MNIIINNQNYPRALRVVGLLIGSLLISPCLIAQMSTGQNDSLNRHYMNLARSSKESDKEIANIKAYDLLQTADENDWITAYRLFYSMKKTAVADSVSNAIKLRFPNGQLVRGEATVKIVTEKDLALKEKLYNEYLQKYPSKDYVADMQYDNVRYSLATAYAETGNRSKAEHYMNLVESPIWQGATWAALAKSFLAKGNTKDAEKLMLKARNHAYTYLTSKRAEKDAAYIGSGFPEYSRLLSEFYFQEKKYKTALKYIRDAHDSSKTINGAINSAYAKTLATLNEYQQAFDVIDKTVKAGYATEEMKNLLKTVYVKVKGNDVGYTEYLASVNKILYEKIKKDLSRKIINEKAPNFTLKDLDGKEVTLSELSGKIVVIDFWATWCGPCKRSFPAMQTAVNRYRNNPDVKFLFIHTWEREEHATDSARSYIAKNNFPFHVLMDLQNAQKVNEVVESFKVQGIPTKFVVDKKGNIRFKFSGFSGGDDAAVEEIAAMVELAGTT